MLESQIVAMDCAANQQIGGSVWDILVSVPVVTNNKHNAEQRAIEQLNNRKMEFDVFFSL